MSSCLLNNWYGIRVKSGIGEEVDLENPLMECDVFLGASPFIGSYWQDVIED
jgi:hypothetical protein